MFLHTDLNFKLLVFFFFSSLCCPLVNVCIFKIKTKKQTESSGGLDPPLHELTEVEQLDFIFLLWKRTSARGDEFL